MRNQILNTKSLMFLFVAVLLTYGTQAVSYGEEAVELVGELDCAENEHLVGDLYRITVKGTIRAVRAVQFLEVTAYIDGGWLGVYLIGNLSAGSSASFSIEGLHTATRDTYSCSVEANWQELVQIQKPDLVVDQPLVSKSTLAPDESFTLSVMVRNRGAARAGGTTLRYYRSTNATISTSDTEVGTDSVSRLDANESGAESITLTAPTSAGTYYYGACVVPVAGESSSDNNCSAAVSITVSQTSTPTQPAGEATYNVGDDIPTLPTGSWYPNRTGGGSKITISGGGTTVELNNGGYMEQGGITYTCVASGGCRIEGRTVTRGTIQVGDTDQPLPVEESDLVVEQPTVSKSTLAPGENFTLSATVRNEGTGGAAATTLRYYRSIDATISTSDTEVGADSVSRLGANGNSAESITLTAPTSAGTYYYGACVEAVTDESSSDNNCSTAVSITVQQPTLSASTPSPLIETTLDGNVITLTLSGGTFSHPVHGLIGGQAIAGIRGVKVSGIPGLTIPTTRVPVGIFINGIQQLGTRYAIDRISDTELEVELAFDGNLDSDATITFTVEAEAIEGYDGPALTAQLSVIAVKAIEFNLSVSAGINLIHVPLKVKAVDGMAKTIESIGDLYDALGGASDVNFLITRDSQTQEWLSYFGASDTGTPANRTLSDDTGIIAGMIHGKDIRLSGDALGTNGSTITLNQGLNLVGLPLRDSRISRVSDLLMLEGISSNVPVIIVTDGGEFKLVGRAGDSGDIEIIGGQAFIMSASRAATVDISGAGWTNASGTAAAPSVARGGIEVDDITPILALRGSIVDEGRGMNNTNFRVIVKNRSTGRLVATATGHEHRSHSNMWGSDGVGYQLTDVDLETGRAATVGDTLEISAQSSHPLIGVEPFEYTVTTEDVRQGWIQLPALIAYEIPSETQLLRNYPNPFNPETWIPYHLANDSDVLFSIYDINGALVRELEVGHQRAGYYTDRSRAAYWNGQNEWGEQVASGVYFYHLSAGDYSDTRKMLILK